MERDGCDRRGRQQRSESEYLSSCKTAVLTWYIEHFNGPLNGAGVKTISVLQTFYLTLSLPFLLLSLYAILPPPCLRASVGLVLQWYGFHQSIITSEGGCFSKTLFPIFVPLFLSKVSFHNAWYHFMLCIQCSFLYSSSQYDNLLSYCQLQFDVFLI